MMSSSSAWSAAEEALGRFAGLLGKRRWWF
jgi:hypothetical protein